MTKTEAITKSLIWRLLIAIPTGLLITYLYVGSISLAVEMTIVGNVIATIIYYLFDLYWYNNVTNYFKEYENRKKTNK